MIQNFSVQIPIVSEEDIYKFLGCKQYSCPSYQMTILYNAKNDNLNIVIDQNGEVLRLKETEEINLTESLSKK